MKMNQSDLTELVEQVSDIMNIVHDAMSAHGDACGERFEKICIEFQECVHFAFSYGFGNADWALPDISTPC